MQCSEDNNRLECGNPCLLCCMCCWFIFVVFGIIYLFINMSINSGKNDPLIAKEFRTEEAVKSGNATSEGLIWTYLIIVVFYVGLWAWIGHKGGPKLPNSSNKVQQTPS